MNSFKNQVKTNITGDRQYETSFINDYTSVSYADISLSRRGISKSYPKIHIPRHITNAQLMCQGTSIINISQKISELCDSVSRKSQKLYGLSIGDKQIKTMLRPWQKAYLCGCYWLLNLEPVMPNQLTETLEKVLEEDQIDEIRVECGQIKFDRMDKSLVYNRQNDCLRITPKQYNIDSLGYPAYEKSLIMIKIGGYSYRFDSLIQQVDSRSNMIAVRTQTSVYIIYLGKVKCQKIKCSCIRWGQQGLYMLEDGGNIALIEIRKQLTKKNLSFQLKSERIGKWVQNDFLVGYQSEMILVSPNRDSITLNVLNGFSTRINLNDIDQKTTIHYANGYLCKKQLVIFLVSGKGEKLENIHQFSFIMI